MPRRFVKAGVNERYAIDVQRAITTDLGMGLAKRNIGDDTEVVAKSCEISRYANELNYSSRC